MEIIINADRFSFSILNDRVKASSLLDRPDVKNAIEFLESQIAILKVYHDGISMGIKKMYNEIDSNGFYKNHRIGFVDSSQADIP